MPLVRIDLVAGKSVEFRKTLGEIIYQAMRDTINVPPNDKFQIITEHAAGEINVADTYLGNTYSRDIMLIQITMNAGRTVEMKKALFKRIADDIHAQLNVRRDDVVINLVEVTKGKLVVRRRHRAIRGIVHRAVASAAGRWTSRSAATTRRPGIGGSPSHARRDNRSRTTGPSKPLRPGCRGHCRGWRRRSKDRRSGLSGY
jgi:4-oxalocrotonate tautomerase